MGFFRNGYLYLSVLTKSCLGSNPGITSYPAKVGHVFGAAGRGVLDDRLVVAVCRLSIPPLELPLSTQYRYSGPLSVILDTAGIQLF